MRQLCDPRAVFRAIEPLLPAELVSHQQRERCRAVAESLPRATSSYYLECRLDEDEQVDFLTLTKHPAAGRLFRESLGAAAVGSSWRRTLALLDDWCSGHAALREIPFFWLEYDIDSRFHCRAPLASPGFCLEPGYLGRWSSSPLVDLDQVRRVATAGLARLLGAEECRQHDPVVRSCIDALPPGGSLVHLSAMLAREPLKLKLFVAIPKPALPVYLGRIGWRGSIQALERILATAYARFGRTVYVDLAVGEELDPTLGLALSQFYEAEVADFTPSWTGITLPGACERKRRAASEWPGLSEATLDGERCWLQRWLDIKMVLDPAGRVRHKAYLGFMPSPRPPFS
jgi:hypothetical protein